jgi:flagellar basal body-associated protein FliL
MQTKKSKIIIILSTVMLLSIATALIYTQTNNNPSIAPTPSPSPDPKLEPKPLEIEVKVTPWGDMYRKEPDTKTDFNVELVHPNNNTNFTTNIFNVTFNAGAFYWIVEKAYYTSDLFSGERWIDISKNQYTQDLQKTFTFNLTNVPQGTHYLTLTVIFHEGTKNNSTATFNVST